MFALLIFWACSENLFGSSGAQGGNCDNKNLDCLQIEAEELFRAGKYKDSYKTYEKIVNKDSNSHADPKRSVGYFGMAKAGLWWDSVTIFNFMGLSGSKDLDGSDPTEIAKFFQDKVPVETQNKYLQGTKKADKALRELNRRDSLTEIYYNFLDEKKDSLTDLFGKTYCSKKLCKDTLTKSEVFPLNKGEEFPLSDMKYRRTFFSTGYAVSALLRTILGSMIFDFGGNGCIFKFSEKKSIINPKEYGCDKNPLEPDIDWDIDYLFTFGEDGMIQVDLLKIYDDLVENPKLVEFLNDRSDSLTNDLEKLIDIVGSITGGVYEAGDTTVTQDSLQKQLNDFKDYALFVRLNDGIDNDGDGCIDEELAVNGKAYDVDGDGLYGEDLRIIPVLQPDAWDCYCDCSEQEYSQECLNKCPLKICTFYPKPPSGKKDDYFIMNIIKHTEEEADTIVRAAWSLVSGFWADEFRNIEDGMARNEFKKEIQVEKDKNGNTRCWPLEERKRRLGGCWKNYLEQDFKNYRNNPLQIEKGGMNKDCIGTY